MVSSLTEKLDGLTLAILNSAYDAIVVIDGEGEVLSWNRRAEELFQWSFHDAVGKNLRDLIIPQKFHEAHNNGIKNFLETGIARILNTVVEIIARRKDGTEFPIELTVSSTKWKKKFIFTGIIRDITEKKVLEEKLQLIRDENRIKLEILVGKNVAKNLTDKTFCNLGDKGETEFDLIIEQFDLIFNNLKKFVSERTLKEARGEIVIPDGQPIALTFTDVEGFTNITQEMQTQIIPVLGMYLENMCQAIVDFGGDVEKFIGDAIFFYHFEEENPEESANQNFDSILKMVSATHALWNDSDWIKLFEKNDWIKFKNLKTRYGMHWGAVTAGAIKSTGDQHRLESTLMGDNVNLTSRMEALAKKYNVYSLLTESYWSKLSSEHQNMCRLVDYVSVKGRETQPLKIFTIDFNKKTPEFLSKYSSGQDYYFKGDWEKARSLFIQAEQLNPDDGPTQHFIDRIEESKNYLARAMDHLERRFLGNIPDFEKFKKIWS